MTDFRALCVELVEAWDSYSYADAGDAADRMAEAVKAARAALAQPAPPAEGEVGELVADELVRRLRTKAATEKSNRCHYSAILLTRAADILEQRHAEPVPVSERLPGPGDCHFNPGAEIGSCWCFNPVEHLGGIAWWSFEPLEWNESATHWLPATALPLPAGEGEE